MFYKIKISGGFAGIQQEFSGDLKITEDRKSILKEIFSTDKQFTTNKNLRDAFNYEVLLEINNKQYKKTFDDKSIPEEVMDLIDEIKKNQDL